MIKVLLIAFLAHFVADFLLQSREMGKKKSEVFSVLSQHIKIQFLVVALFLIPFIGFMKAIDISFLNALVHGLIDWNIWRGYKAVAHYRIMNQVAGSNTAEADYKEAVANFKFWDDHYFYATIGLDQLLHISTLTALIGYML